MIVPICAICQPKKAIDLDSVVVAITPPTPQIDTEIQPNPHIITNFLFSLFINKMMAVDQVEITTNIKEIDRGLRLIISYQQFNGKYCPLPNRTLHLNRPLMLLNNPLSNR